MTTRRQFLKSSAAAGAFLSLQSSGFARILGANDRLVFAVLGVNSRGMAHVSAILQTPNCEIGYICDVDSRALAKAQKVVEDKTGRRPKGFRDIRELLKEPDLDVITIATPEHWHAPMAIMGLQAGKHVYVEKPCSHNGREAEMLMEAQAKYGKLVQMGNQQRSAPSSIQGIQDIRDGLIGEVHLGKAWYANDRKGIGTGKPAAVPEWLDWELWQGPAPRREYTDNVVHYNWHWFKHWGTGEVHNNGTHEIDICRWALGVDYPTRVTSSGGRYFYQDDWEFPDTNVVNYEFSDGKMISWEGNSCIPLGFRGMGRGAMIYGSKGAAVLTRNFYEAFDLRGNSIKRVNEDETSATTDTRGEGNLDIFHMRNFANGIREGEALHADIQDGAKSTILCHLGNLAFQHGGVVKVDSTTGRVVGNELAMKDWAREYEPGWELHV
ncbi:MAG: Gfo/Idh/MocA family oxidoreductase [Bacteroidia bacterium]|nr:Gfo/Idh/MocA family oxidoreductase [Bacteroidia bacterium]